MTNRLTNMTWDDVQKEMSIAGNPEKITALCKSAMDQIEQTVDMTNAAELINIEFGISRILAEVRLWKRMYEKRTGQKIT